MTQDTEKTEEIVKNGMDEKIAPEVEQSANDMAQKEESKYKDKYYYLAAEYDNAIKRLEREKSNIIKFGSENILRDIIGSVDLFELTVQALVNDEDPKVKNIVVGLEMIRKQLLETLTRNGLEKVASLNKPFDPNFHEAVAQEQNDQVADDTVVKELQAGYKLNGRLLRAAKVVVSKSK